MDEQFINDTEDGRICGTCEEHKPFEEFYKDGKDTNGKIRYRRDCKTCYKIARMHERKAREAIEMRKMRSATRK